MADLLHERNFHDLRRFISTPFLAAKMERVRKGVTPREIVYEEDSSWIPWQRPCGVSPVGLSHVEAHRQPDRKAHQPDGKHPPGRIRRRLSVYGNVVERQHSGARRGLSRICEIPLPA